MLSFFSQIWGSDDTDAIVRAEIQNNYSYGYPLSCIGCHVSSVPNHQTLRLTPLETRFNVAAFGSLGYEMNMNDISEEQLCEITSDISLYKKYRDIFQNGIFYRGRSFNGNLNVFDMSNNVNCGNIMEWTVVSDDRTKAVSMILVKEAVPNHQELRLYPKGLDDAKMYHFQSKSRKMSVRTFGDLINTVSPVHIKADSKITGIIDIFVKMKTESEDFTLTGDTMMYGGVPLKPAYSGTGINSDTRIFTDYSSRLYIIEEKSEIYE